MFKITFIIDNRMDFIRCATLEIVRQVINALEEVNAQIVSIKDFRGENVYI